MRLSENGIIKKGRKIISSFLAVGTTVISQIFRPAPLPEPAGPYAVNVTSFEWVDESRPETFSANVDDKRTLLVKVWYPIEKTGGEFKPNITVPDIFPAQNRPVYPVLVFSHGFGMMPDQYTLLMKELASHGYVIFCIAHPYEAAAVVYPGGRVVTMSPQVVRSLKSDRQKQTNELLNQYQTAAGPDAKNQLLRQYDALAGEIVQNSLKIWTEDTIFVLGKIGQLNHGQIPGQANAHFAGHLDLEHLGIFGHSFGGTIAGKVCLQDNRIKAGVNMDGHQYGQFEDFQCRSLQQPFMIMYSESPPGPGINDFMYHRINNWSYRIFIKNAKHIDFTDLPMNNPAISKASGESGTIDPERMMLITNSYLLAFFNKHLKGIESPLLDVSNQSFPEVDFQMRKGDESHPTAKFYNPVRLKPRFGKYIKSSIPMN